MNLPQHPIYVLLAAGSLFGFSAMPGGFAVGQDRPVRNRPTYQSPVLEEVVAPAKGSLSRSNGPLSLQPVPKHENKLRPALVGGDVAQVSGEEEDTAESPDASRAEPLPSPKPRAQSSPNSRIPSPMPEPMQEHYEMHEPAYAEGPVYENYGGSVGCDSGFCGSPCDSMGCDGACGPAHPFHTDLCLLDLPVLLHTLLFNEQKFYSTDLLLWWHSGQRLPALVTTSAAGTTQQNAGVLGLASTSVIFGGGDYGEENTTGFRLEAGHWLDPHHCRSVTARLWGAGKADFSFNANSTQFPILARPFLDVANANAPVQAAQLVAFGTDSGSINIHGSSDVYGADVLLRRVARRGLGGRLDWIMGYQMMRINQDLGIASFTTQGANSPNPGATLAVNDAFDTENEFHGFAFGWQGHYRDCRWTLETLLKVGLGNVHRSATVSGSTTTTNAGGIATVNEGLLARATNIGAYSTDSFAAAPEVQLAIGYQLSPYADLTFGYSFLAVGNVMQPEDLIDPRRAVNLAANVGGAQNPSSPLTDSNFWVQGIHFGLDFNW